MRRTLPTLAHKSNNRRNTAIRRALLACLCLLFAADVALADEMLGASLQTKILPDRQTLDDVRRVARPRILPVPEPTDPAAWTQFADSTRKKVLDEVVFRGKAAQEWRTAATRVEFVETIPGGTGYRIDKYRIEVLPGLWIPALLYLPDAVAVRTDSAKKYPVFLQVNGHDPTGKAADYKQARCIHLARNQVVSLNLEWFGMGQLATPGFGHGKLNQLDLCGSSGLAPFYLAMSRGLDFLLSQDYADSSRVGVAGLSGGGWQTILLSSLDTRVTLCNPVAGYSSFLTRMDHFSDLGDSEQTPVDLGVTADYAQLTALLAPRAALLTYNDKDNCCFASGHALPPLMQAATPVYQLLGAGQKLRMHVNSDPGTHNFLIDNRQALYRMIRDQWFEGKDTDFAVTEQSVEADIKSKEALNIPLPDDNLDFVKLALSVSATLPASPPIPESEPARADWEAAQKTALQQIIRLQNWKADGQQHSMSLIEGAEMRHWKLRMGEDWTVPVIEVFHGKPEKSMLVISDGGRSSVTAVVSQLVKDNYRVYVVDVFGFGECQIPERGYLWNLMISTAGQRPLGVQVGQILSTSAWIRESHPSEPLSLMTSGPRTSVIGVISSVLIPAPFAELRQEARLESLKLLLNEQSSFEQSPELYCFGLLEAFDITDLQKLVRVPNK
ncbi:MAG: hypothetical protein JNL58_03560 [Planctomyces sp.]|nr:hypothetical protein [Planctomyces sp.]